MTPRFQRFGAVLAACGVLGACGGDRTASTEVENELTTLLASTEDTVDIVAARWVLTDGSDTLATGITDSTGSIVADFEPSSAPYLYLSVVSGAETLQTVIEARGSDTSDTLRAGVNLFTNLVARSWSPGSSLSRFGDSLARAFTGVPLPYSGFASPQGMRSPEAEVFLGVLQQKVQRSGSPMVRYVDSLAHAPGGGGMLHDSAFTRDMTDALRRQALPADSQDLVVQRIDSLGGQNGKLFQTFQQDQASADSVLLVSVAPWLASSQATELRGTLIARSQACATAILAQPRPAFPSDIVKETSRRVALRTYAHLLGDLSASPDSAGRAALTILLSDADSTLRETFLILKIDKWFGKDIQADQLLAPVYASQRRSSWKTSDLVKASNPKDFAAAGWPLPHGATLRNAIVAALQSGRWGQPGDLLVPDSSSASN